MSKIDGKEVYPGKWLKAADLDYGSRAMTIREYRLEEIGQDMETKPVMYFDDEDKGLVVNVTNDRRLTELLGDDSENWRGHLIDLYVTKVAFGKKEVDAIRVRPGQVIEMATENVSVAADTAAHTDEPPLPPEPSQEELEEVPA